MVARELSAQGVELCRYLAIVAVGLGILLLDRLVGAECVEHAELEAFAIEQQVLVLRMYVDEAFAQLLQDGKRHGAVVDEGAALACSCNLAAHDALGIILDVVLLKQVMKVVARDVKGAFDDTFRSSGAYGCSLGTLTREQTDGTEKDGLTGTRLTGDDREPLGKIKVERLYERVVLYM